MTIASPSRSAGTGVDPERPEDDPTQATESTELTESDELTGRTAAFQRARRRRARRDEKLSGRTLEPFLSRVRGSARRMPFILALVVMLGAALVGVLWLNTLTDEVGIQTNDARRAVSTLQLQIEGVSADIAARNATPAIAQAAASLGLVPAGDAAILVVPGDPAAEPSEIGTPIAVVDPSVIAAQDAAAAAAAAAESAAAASAAAVDESAASASAASQAAATASTDTASAGIAPATAAPVGAAVSTAAPADPNSAATAATTSADVTPVEPAADPQPAAQAPAAEAPAAEQTPTEGAG